MRCEIISNLQHWKSYALLKKKVKGKSTAKDKTQCTDGMLQHVEGRLSKCSSSVSGLNEKALKHLQPSYQYSEEIKIILSLKFMGQASIGDNDS